MTNIIQKIIKVLIILLMIQIIFAIGNASHAAGGINWGNIIDAGNDFVDTGKNEAADGKISTSGSDGANITLGLPSNAKIKVIINDIYNVLFPLGVAITVIVGGILGIKFMMASAEDKAKIKESLVPYVAGCVVIYGAFGIWKIAILVFSSIS